MRSYPEWMSRPLGGAGFLWAIRGLGKAGIFFGSMVAVGWDWDPCLSAHELHLTPYGADAAAARTLRHFGLSDGLYGSIPYGGEFAIRK